MDRDLISFLKITRCTRWVTPPHIWQRQLRTALSDNLVRVGRGGRLELTAAGDAAIANSMVD